MAVVASGGRMEDEEEVTGEAMQAVGESMEVPLAVEALEASAEEVMEGDTAEVTEEVTGNAIQLDSEEGPTRSFFSHQFLHKS